MTSEVREMRRRLEAGEPLVEIGASMGRHSSTVRFRGDVNYRPGRAKALRLENLFAACNRALEGR